MLIVSSVNLNVKYFKPKFASVWIENPVAQKHQFAQL